MNQPLSSAVIQWSPSLEHMLWQDVRALGRLKPLPCPWGLYAASEYTHVLASHLSRAAENCFVHTTSACFITSINRRRDNRRGLPWRCTTWLCSCCFTRGEKLWLDGSAVFSYLGRCASQICWYGPFTFSGGIVVTKFILLLFWR